MNTERCKCYTIALSIFIIKSSLRNCKNHLVQGGIFIPYSYYSLLRRNKYYLCCLANISRLPPRVFIFMHYQEAPSLLSKIVESEKTLFTSIIQDTQAQALVYHRSTMDLNYWSYLEVRNTGLESSSSSSLNPKAGMQLSQWARSGSIISSCVQLPQL